MSVVTVVTVHRCGRCALTDPRSFGHRTGPKCRPVEEPVHIGAVRLKGPSRYAATPDFPSEIALAHTRASCRFPRKSRCERSPLRALALPLVWLLTIPNFVTNVAVFAYNFWEPTLLREMLGTSYLSTGLISGGIALLAAGAFIFAGTISDRRDEPCGLAALGLMFACVGFVGLALLRSPLQVIALVVIALSGPTIGAPFWCLPTKFLKGPAAASGIALINAIGSCGGFVGPTVVGFFRQTATGDTGAFFAIAALALVGSLVCVALRQLTMLGPTRQVISARP